MLIATGKLTQTTLADKIALVTGAGGGIGYEACRCPALAGRKDGRRPRSIGRTGWNPYGN